MVNTGGDRADVGMVLPFEFVVLGEPLSHQAGNRAALRMWRELVRASAQHRWPAGSLPLDSRLKIVVVYFHTGMSSRMDNDNMLKPIQDALIGLVYKDDQQITDSVVRKTARRGAFVVSGIARVLADAFTYDRAFVYVRIEEAPDHRELL